LKIGGLFNSSFLDSFLLILEILVSIGLDINELVMGTWSILGNWVFWNDIFRNENNFKLRPWQLSNDCHHPKILTQNFISPWPHPKSNKTIKKQAIN
jgi:hypothetical protein